MSNSAEFSCARCGAKWGGALSVAHCAACHQTFTGISAFDTHRSGSHANSTRHCLDPYEIGLVDAERAYPCWGVEGDRTEFWAQ